MIRTLDKFLVVVAEFLPERVLDGLATDAAINDYNLMRGLFGKYEGLTEREVSFLTYLMVSLKIHHHSSFTHSFRVKNLSKFIVQQSKAVSGFTSFEILELASLLHDVGKLWVPVEILDKPAVLNIEEYELAKKHALGTVELLNKVKESDFLGEVISIAGSHHEKFNGNGYPRGLQGEEVSFIVQALALADTIDSITSNRSYLPNKNIADVKEQLFKEIADMEFYFEEAVYDLFMKLPVEQMQKYIVNTLKVEEGVLVQDL